MECDHGGATDYDRCRNASIIKLYANWPLKREDKHNAHTKRTSNSTRRAVPFVQSRTMATSSERRDLTMLVQEETGMLPSDVGVVRAADHEQFEWHAAFVKAARTHLRTENHTRGLRGTDIGQLTTVAMVTVALTISPSLQYRRPDGHPIAAAQWPAARRRLFG